MVDFIVTSVVVVLSLILAPLWIVGGARALVVGIAAIPKLFQAKKEGDQFAIVRLDTEIWCLGTSPLYLAGAYGLMKYLVALI
jgi:hypothetical protein